MKIAAVLALVLLAGAAPAVAATDWPHAQAMSVVTAEYQFSPNHLTFKRGVAYRLHLENRGKEMHEFTAPEFFKTVVLRSAKPLNADKSEVEIPPGMAKDVYFVPQRSGRYPLRCSDHDWAGMTGDITVE